MERESATFLFADLAGFTALTEAHGDVRAADVAAHFCADARRIVGDRGAVLKTIGDAVMVRFPIAADAISAGLRITSELGGEHHAPTIRVGMHHGTAVERDGDWFGLAVNVAARVAALAAGGEVLLTDATRRAAGELDGITLRHHGTHRLRNVTDPIAVLRAVATETAARALDVDPVCRMAVDPSRAAGWLVHEGREYRFCSLECASRFASAPGRFTAGMPTAGPHGSHNP
jgi:adenylate cyclase